MSRFGKNMSRRILAYLLSGAMIMSNMTAFASEAPQDTGEEYAYEQTADADDAETDRADEADDANETIGNDDGKESSDETTETTVKETEVKDSEQTTETKASDEKSASETRSSLRMEKEDKEKTASDIDNKEVTFVAEGTVDFKSVASNGDLTIYESQGITIGDSFASLGDNHGIKATDAAATVVLNLQTGKTATIIVETCNYNDTDKNEAEEANKTKMEYSFGDKSGRIQRTAPTSGADNPKYVLENASGEVTLSFTREKTYIHSITVEYSNDEGGDTNAFVAEGTVSFKNIESNGDLTGYKSQGITIGDSFASLGNGHGIQASDAQATVVLNLQTDKTATITVETCIHNDSDKNEAEEANKTKMKYSFGDKSGTIQRTVPTSGNDDPKYVLENASGKVTLSFTAAKTYIHSITVEYNTGGDTNTFVAEGTVNFKNIESNGDLTGYKSQGITIGDSFASLGNGHGIQASDAQATVVLNLQTDKTATITVETCIHNDSDKNEAEEANKTKMKYSFGDKSGTIQRAVPTSGNDDPKYVLENASGEVTLSFTAAKTYIHSITVEYNTGGETDSFVEDGETINFKEQCASNTGVVKAEDVKSKVEDQEKVANAFTFSGFSWHDSHGIHQRGTIELNLEQGKRAVITVKGCGFGSGETVTTNSGVVKETETDTILPGDNDKAPQFLIMGAQGKVRLTFGGTNYIHEISVKYMTDSEHVVSVSSDENGTAAADIAVAEKDIKITLTSEPNAGFEFDRWEVISGGVTVANDNTFIMPDTDVEIKAIFKSNGVDPAEIPDDDGFYNGLLASEIKDDRPYYYDFSTSPIDTGTLTDTFEKGLFTYNKGQATKNAYWHSAKYGMEFAVGNKITFQVSGDSYIVVGGGDSNSRCDLLRASSEQGSVSPESLNPVKSGQGTLTECKNKAGNVLVYEYTGAKGSVTLTFDTTNESLNKAYITCACVIPKEKEDPNLPTYTYIFDPSLEGIADNNKVTEAGSKYVNGYFEIVDGTITGKGSKVELQNNAKSAIQFTTKEQSVVSVVAESTSGTNKSNMVLYKLTSENSWQIIEDIKEVEGNTAVTIKYDNLAAGTYKVAVPSEEHPNGRGVRISKVEVKENLTPVTVTVNASVPENAPALSLEFTCRETNKKITQAIENKTCVVTLNALYTYDVVVNPTTYVISEGAELKLGAANEDKTATHSITIEAVSLRTLEGLIKGLDEDAEALKNLQISFQKPEDKIYVPEISINKDAKSYSAQLESGVEYLIVTEGINDYELDYAASNNSDKIKITSPVSGRNITYKKKPVYAVTINPEGAEPAGLAEAVFEFTNLNEEGYVYTFTGTENIKLRDGTYSVKVSNSGIYTPKLIPNLTIDGQDTILKIRFTSEAATKWDFTDAENYNTDKTVKNPCVGLTYTVNESGMWKDHASNYGSMAKNIEIHVPVSGSGKVILAVGYTWDITSGSVSDVIEDNSDHGTKLVEIPYTNAEKVDITVGTKSTTYIKTIEVVEAVEYKETITVGMGENYDYNTINDALDAVRAMERTADQSVTISIQPGDYEEMLVIDQSNVKLVNAAGADASIGLRNKGVDIDPTAVRITSYYGVGYNYYSMGSDYKWNEEVLEVNKANGSASCVNPPDGGTASWWNATVVISASNVTAEGIIFENSFNQYISKKAAEDVIVKQGGAKEGKVPRASMAYGDTTVQQKDYVERAAALAITNNCSKVMFNNCKFIGRQDTLYGGTPVTAAFYKCAIYGGTDYIFGGMTAVFAKCDLVFNTNDRTDAGMKNDIGYITASQTKTGHGYLMYNCHVTSTMPGVDTESQYTSKPGYLGRPWLANTGEAIFYKTIIDEVDTYWQDYYKNLDDDDKNKILSGKSLIAPVGWNSSLNGESALSKEFGTYEVSGVDNNSSRASWATTLTENPYESDAAAVTTFLGDWDAFAGKDMDVVLPSDENIAAPAAPKAIVSPETTKEGNVEKIVKGATVVLSAEAGAKVYYNVNADSDPTEDSQNLYSKAIEINGNINDTVTIKAIAVKYGKTSSVATFTYTIAEAPAPDSPVLTPTTGSEIRLGSRVMMSAAKGAEIYYNINSDTAPSADTTANGSKRYTGKLGVEITLDDINKTDSTVKIQAVAVMNGKTSDPITAIYNVTVNAPTADPRSGYQFPDGGGTVKLTADEDVTILYTMGSDPADPTADNAETKTYTSSGIKVNADTTIKAVAKRGTKFSKVVTINYIVPLSMPKATPESGSVLPKNARTVQLQADEGAEIYYTMGENPADPTSAESNPTLYQDTGITVNEATTIKAVAVKGNRRSPVAVFTYTVTEETYPQAEMPTVTTVNGQPLEGSTVEVEVDTDVVIMLASATPEAVIYYTLNGDIPTASAEKYDAENGIKLSPITEETVVKAVATKEGMLDSGILTFTITVKEKNNPNNPDDPDKEKDPIVITLMDEGVEVVVPSIIQKKETDPIKPETYVTYKGYRFIEGIDYSVSEPSAPDADGFYTVTLTGLERDNAGRMQETYKIAKEPTRSEKFKVVSAPAKGDTSVVDISKAKLNLDASAKNAVYTGSAIEPKLDFSKDNTGLEAKIKDRILYAYKNNINAGKATVTISVKPAKPTDADQTIYAGSKTFTFNIKKAALNKNQDKATAKVVYEDPADLQYKGNGVGIELKSCKVTAGEAPNTVDLRKGRDYTITYKNNAKAGKATVTIKGIGNNVSGSWSTTYTITALDLSELTINAADQTMYYSPKGAKLGSITAKKGNDIYILKEGTDFTAKYTYDDKATKAAGTDVAVMISGKNGCTGKNIAIADKIRIVPADFEKCISVSSDVVLDKTTKSGKEQAALAKALAVTDTSGAKLKLDKDYSMTLSTDSETKAPIIIIEPVDATNTNYKGSMKVPYRVAANLAKEKTFVMNKKLEKDEPLEYDGRNPVQITQKDIDKYISNTYKLGTNITIVPGTYKNNTKKGTAQVTVQGIGEFYGTKVLKFKIVEK